MKSIKDIFSFFKKKEEEPKKVQPKERKDHSLERFVDAQERMYEMALAEVKSGKKLSHWRQFHSVVMLIQWEPLQVELQKLIMVVYQNISEKKF